MYHRQRTTPEVSSQELPVGYTCDPNTCSSLFLQLLHAPGSAGPARAVSRHMWAPHLRSTQRAEFDGPGV
jgi:hypothetical protein